MTTRTLAEYDLSMPRCLNLGPPLKLLGLLELRSRLWNTIFPDEFILGLSAATPRLAAASSDPRDRIGLRPARPRSDDGVADLGLTVRILG